MSRDEAHIVGFGNWSTGRGIFGGVGGECGAPQFF